MSDPSRNASRRPLDARRFPIYAKVVNDCPDARIGRLFPRCLFKSGRRRGSSRPNQAKRNLPLSTMATPLPFIPGLAPDVDFVVPLNRRKCRKLASICQRRQFRAPTNLGALCRCFSPPCTRAALQSPTVRRNWLRMITGVESVIHVHLVDPDGGDAVRHTLAYAGDQWLVISGLAWHGQAHLLAGSRTSIDVSAPAL